MDTRVGDLKTFLLRPLLRLFILPLLLPSFPFFFSCHLLLSPFSSSSSSLVWAGFSSSVNHVCMNESIQFLSHLPASISVQVAATFYACLLLANKNWNLSSVISSQFSSALTPPPSSSSSFFFRLLLPSYLFPLTLFSPSFTCLSFFPFLPHHFLSSAENKRLWMWRCPSGASIPAHIPLCTHSFST